MFYDPTRLEFLNPIIKNVDTIVAEFNQAMLNLNEFKKCMTIDSPEIYSHIDHWTIETGIHSDKLGYDSRVGTLGAFPIYKKGFPIKWYNVHNHFPGTLALISTVPDLYFSSIVRLGSNSAIASHHHSIPHLVFHITLFNHEDGGSYIKCGHQTANFFKQGDCCLFDYRIEHSSFNNSKKDRINLLIDFPISSDFELVPLK